MTQQNLSERLVEINKTVRNNPNMEIQEEIQLQSGILKVYTQNQYLVFEIPHGSSVDQSAIKTVTKNLIQVFGCTLLPNPSTQSLRTSVEIETL